jgi:hypothetical protein
MGLSDESRVPAVASRQRRGREWRHDGDRGRARPRQQEHRLLVETLRRIVSGELTLSG